MLACIKCQSGGFLVVEFLVELALTVGNQYGNGGIANE
jgi:hypothetical protein